MTVERRLSAAREALFGQKRARGRSKIADELEFYHIVKELRKSNYDVVMRFMKSFSSEDQGAVLQKEIDRKPNSMRGAAGKQAENARRYENREEQSIIDRLRRKAVKSKLTTQDMADLEGLINGNSVEVRLLQRLLHDLQRLGIEVDSTLVQNTPD